MAKRAWKASAFYEGDDEKEQSTVLKKKSRVSQENFTYGQTSDINANHSNENINTLRKRSNVSQEYIPNGQTHHSDNSSDGNMTTVLSKRSKVSLENISDSFTHINNNNNNSDVSMTLVRREKSKISKEVIPDSQADDTDDDDSGVHTSLTQSTDLFQTPTMSQAPCQNGNIQRIILKNFMCHNKLDVKLGTHVNFIIGRNGSGKSAVVTAIILGLGGKASATNRGSSIKGFIKSGKPSAEIIIHLNNEGLDAYKSESYGDTIIIERKFSKDGGGTYRIKSASGQVISTKREELRNILDAFNILVDNPIVVLNQEVSRNFLHSKNPTDKYKFFLRATQLAQIQEDYNEAKTHKTEAKSILRKKEESFPVLEAELRAWEKKYKAFNALENQKEKIKKLRSEMAWSLVIGREATLHPHLKIQKEEEARLPKFERKLEETTTKLNNAKIEIDRMTEASKALEDEERVLLPDVETCKQHLLNCKNKLRAKQNEVKKLKMNISKSKQDWTKIKERIGEIKSSALQTDHEAEKKRRLMKIKALQDKMGEIDHQKQAKQDEMNDYHKNVTHYKNEVYRIDKDMRSLQRAIGLSTMELNNMKASLNNSLKKYGAHMPDVINRIDRDYKAGKFHQKPLGPVGEWIDLENPMWGLAVECCLKTLITAFCVNDYEDSLQLEKIFRETCPPGVKAPMFIISQFQPKMHNVANHAPRNCPHPTVLDVLRIKHVVIGNCLIDQRGIEHVILFKTPQEARQVMRNLQINGVREGFTADGDQIFPEPNYRYYSSGKEHARFLSVNTSVMIEKYTKELAGKIDDGKRLMEEKKQFTSQVTTNRHEEQMMQNEIGRMTKTMQELDAEKKQLEMVEDPEPVDILVLEDECTKISEHIERLNEKSESVVQENNELESEVEGAEKNYLLKESNVRTLSSKLESFKEDFANIQTHCDEAKAHQKHYETKKKEQEQKIKLINQRIKKIECDIKSDEEKACLICPTRINTRRKTEDIESEIREINKQIEATEKSQGDRDDTTRRFHETKEALWKIKKEVGSLKKFLNHLDRAMDTRDSNYLSCRLIIALRMKQIFVVFLHSRQYIGQLSFDHENGTLEITVNPRRSENDKSGKNVKSLSGGERSFATVCFILSLWGGTGSPFRCLDEFDVFMDMVNRRICMDMMLQVAKQQRSRQYIFLTPQNMSYLVCSTAKIFRMPDPIRLAGGQKTLSQSQITGVSQDDDDDDDDRPTASWS